MQEKSKLTSWFSNVSNGVASILITAAITSLFIAHQELAIIKYQVGELNDGLKELKVQMKEVVVSSYSTAVAHKDIATLTSKVMALDEEAKQQSKSIQDLKLELAGLKDKLK